MKRPSAIVGSAIFLVAAPGTVALWIPWMISRWHVAPALLGLPALRVVGVLLILAGLPVLLDSFARFALEGLGTPAPIAPPRHLVVTGWYRFVRNPMYVAIVAMITGQGLLFGRVTLLEYALAVWVLFYAWVLINEEPHLRRSFGSEYAAYCRAVHRWIPRVRPFTSPAAGATPRA